MTEDNIVVVVQQQEVLVPPIARRDEDRVVYAGVAPTDWPSDVPRQSEDSNEPLLDPPIAVSDPYGWLRDEKRTNTEVLNYLHAENNYTQSIVQKQSSEEIITTLYNEMISSVQETDYTTPRPDGPYWYYTRTYQGKSYTTYCRAPKPSGTTTTSLPTITWKATLENAATIPILDGEEIIFDVNELAIGQSHCSIGSVVRSPSHTLLAYAVDFSGNEIYELQLKDLTTSRTVTLQKEISSSIKWGNSDNVLFYELMDSIHRPFQVYQKTINPTTIFDTSNTENEESSTTNDDILLFEDLNDMFWVGISKSLDGQYLFIESSSTETSEIHYVRLLDNDNDKSSSSPPIVPCIAPRRNRVLYDVEHHNGYWWILSNVGNLPNMGLFTSPAVPNSQDLWELVVDATTHSPCFDGGYTRALDGISCFNNYIVTTGREGGIPRIWILHGFNTTTTTTTATSKKEVITTGSEEDVANDNTTTKSTTNATVVVDVMERLVFSETAYDVGLGSNKEYNTDTIAVSYSSLITPPQTIEISLSNPEQQNRTILKEKEIPGYNKENYGCERTTVLSRDGNTEIPVSIVYKKDIMEQHNTTKEPVNVHLYGYGSYAICVEADFQSTRLPLLNRGIVYVLAHIRGGGEMGRQWYEEPNGAKYLCKLNTFYDYIDVASWLLYDRKLTTSSKLSIEGRSAGGMLIGTTINMQPNYFKVAIMPVPFVDVVPTMIDASIPLTAGEWEEWGNPNEQKYFHYMMSYSPIQNIKPQPNYPSVLITCGLHDPRVQYWEPAKYVATLRYAIQQYKEQQNTSTTNDDIDTTSNNNNNNVVCFKCDMTAGHFSASDRYKYLKEKAFDYAFLLSQLGIPI